MERNAFVLNTIKYDHSDKYLHTIKDETFFYLKIFTDAGDPDKTIDGEFNLNDIELDANNVSVYDHFATVNGEFISIGLALVNIAAKFTDIVIKPGISRQNLSREIFRDSVSNDQYFARLSSLSNFLNCAGLLIEDQSITVPINECNSIVNQAKTYQILKKLPNHPIVGYIVYRSIAANIMDWLPNDSKMHKFRKTKFGEIQFSRSLISTGYVSDHNNITSGKAILNSTFGGLTEDEFFATAFGARKGITDKSKVMPDSGYLERSMVMGFSSVEIVEEDCGSKYGFPIKIENRTHAKSLVGRYYTSSGSDVWTKLDPETAKDLVGQEISVRSPITCITENHKICRKCFGDNRVPTPYVGILSGMYLTQGISQLTMRSFHLSGSATYAFSDDLLKFFKLHLTDLKNHSDRFSLIFDRAISKTLLTELKSITHDTFIDNKSSSKVLVFEELSTCMNDDVSTILNAVKGQLTADNKATNDSISSSYHVLMDNMLSIGFIESIFIEIALCNTFLNSKDRVFRTGLRDAQLNDVGILPITKRLNVKSIHRHISPLLSLLYEPNSKSIRNMYEETLLAKKPENLEKMTIFERIWMGQL